LIPPVKTTIINSFNGGRKPTTSLRSILMKNLLVAAAISVSSLFFLPGCATGPTQQQEVVINSGIRISTVAYITRGKTADVQAQRAMQLVSITSEVRKHINANGDVVANLDELATYANAYILSRKDLTEGDKTLAQAVVLEAIYLASDTIVANMNIGAENAARVLGYLNQVDRVAKAFAVK
jgi:hypothetical protein